MEEQLWLEEKEADILTPLLIRRDQSQPLSAVDAQQLHQDCLNEFKLRQAAHADLIQERYAMVGPLIAQCPLVPVTAHCVSSGSEFRTQTKGV